MTSQTGERTYYVMAGTRLAGPRAASLDSEGAGVMNAWREVYTRCMDGEYFRGAYCPRDGHSDPASIAIDEVVRSMHSKGVEPSLDALISEGYSGPLDEVIVVEFASEETAPDLLFPGRG